MRLSWMSAALGLAVGLTVSVQAIAQVQPQPYDAQPYETPRYTPSVPAPLDKSYGLPTFGMPGAGLPQQRATTPDIPPLDKADLLKARPDFDFARAREWTPGGTAMETPLFTTSESLTTGDTTQSETGGFGTQAPAGRKLETGGFDTDTTRGR